MTDSVLRDQALVYGMEEDTPSIYDIFSEPWPRTIGVRVRVTPEVYFFFLNLLPPIYCKGGFLVSEADSETSEGIVYSKFTERGGEFFHEFAVIPRRTR